MQNVQLHLGYDKLFMVDLNGIKYNLALFYNDSYNLQILYSSNRIIDVESIMSGNKLFMSFIYGDPIVKSRKYVLEKLTRRSLHRKDSLIMVRDILMK